jgi:D-alanyl-D-alanine dipeptidase
MRLLTLVAAAAALAGCASGGRPSPAPAPAAVETGDLPVATSDVAERLLVDVASVDSTIGVEMRYATNENFTGTPLPGYEANRALLRREPAYALSRVQRRLAGDGLALKVFDAYRPVRASVAMVDWAERTGREELLRDGYIASRSRHNLGLAVDLTLVDRASGVELEMGTPFDTFTEAAHTANARGDAARNRQRLKAVMEAEGFVNYDKEWWHYSYSLPNPVRFDWVIR